MREIVGYRQAGGQQQQRSPGSGQASSKDGFTIVFVFISKANVGKEMMFPN
jgi:hypothetical protein